MPPRLLVVFLHGIYGEIYLQYRPRDKGEHGKLHLLHVFFRSLSG